MHSKIDKTHKTAFFLGRFQPIPHNGHIAVVEDILEQYEKLIIGLGSAQYARQISHFATLDERKELWDQILRNRHIDADRYLIVGIDDIGDNDCFVDHVKKIVPHFDEIITGNILVKRLFRDAGVTVQTIHKPYFGVSNTKIRRMLLEGEDISYLVPRESAVFLEEHLKEFLKIHEEA